MSYDKRPWWEVGLLCTPQAVEDEESYLLEYGQHELPHDQLVSRWQAMLSAKEWLESQLPAISITDSGPTPTTPPAECRACLSTPCSCEGYRR